MIEEHGQIPDQKIEKPRAHKKFGEILLEVGLISNDTLMTALERQKGSGKVLGHILEEMGVISQNEIIEALTLQNRKLEELLVDPHRQYRRFKPIHTVLHLMLVISFLGLTFTGLPLRFSDQKWAVVLISTVGGATGAAFIHRFCAVMNFTSFGIAVMMSIKFLFLKKDIPGNWFQRLTGPESLFPNMRDLKDLRAMIRWFLFKAPKPTFERWAYWEKFDFLADFWGMFVIGGSGLMLWWPEFFSSFLPGWSFNVATIIHSYEALLAIVFIFSVHFFNTHGRPEKFPMDFVIFNGQISKHEFIEERGDQWSRLESQGELHKYEVKVTSSVLYDFVFKGIGFIAFFSGVGLLLLILFAFFGNLL